MDSGLDYLVEILYSVRRENQDAEKVLKTCRNTFTDVTIVFKIMEDSV
jgi:hypothetical protein